MSTVDGALTALDTQGHTLWSYHLHDPLFSSTLSYVEVGSVCVCVCRSVLQYDSDEEQDVSIFPPCR